MLVFRAPSHERDETDYRVEENWTPPAPPEVSGDNAERIIQWVAWSSLGMSLVVGIGSLPYFWKRKDWK
jgi:hypothetical protein